MHSIQVSTFKATCLQLMDSVARTGEEIIITKNGKPISKLVPYETKPALLYGIMKNSIITHDDITQPIDENWGGLARLNDRGVRPI